jgi:hypothetical protein
VDAGKRVAAPKTEGGMRKKGILLVLLRKREKKYSPRLCGSVCRLRIFACTHSRCFAREKKVRKKNGENGEILLTVPSYSSLVPPVSFAWMLMVS